MERYQFLQKHPSLIKAKAKIDLKSLKELIDDIDENINGYIRTYKYYDVLGQFYIEFLRYSNTDKGLGIVLTPPHITEFFSGIVDIKPTDIVYDNCTGTGGFLVSAMKKMIDKAEGDSEREKNIRKNQLYGTELQTEIYPLVVSNMFLHDDGKSNILNKSCFEENVIEYIKKIKPNIAFLNPPYKMEKNDTEEFEFVLNALNSLKEGGQCVAIIPMSCVLAQSGERLRLKETLLAQHTLKAVFSMPNELFHNSKVGTNTCIVVFEAYIPHSKDKETFFGYFKDDGFLKRKAKGRFDYNKKWQKIKTEWLYLFINNKEKDGYSISKIVVAKDEWCAEAYMKTNYSNLKELSFKNTIHNYIIFLLTNNIKTDIQYAPCTEKDTALNFDEWLYFDLEYLFIIKGTKTTHPLTLLEYEQGAYPYITTQATNNGVGSFYNFNTEKGNVITIDSAVIGYASYQEYDFSASDHVEQLIPKFNNMSVYIALFIVAVLNQEQYRYNYGRKASQTRLKNIKIKLPASSKDSPNWQFMEDYIKSLPYSSNL